MSVLSHRDRKTTRRRPRTFRPEFQATVEGLESRMVLSAASAAAAVPAAISPQQLDLQNLLSNLQFAPQSIDVTNGVVSVVGTLTGDLLGHSFTLNNISVPVNLTQQVTPEGNVLHLELGPLDLNLLGLNVHLDNCSGGPVTVDISSTLLSSTSPLTGIEATLGSALTGLLNDLTNLTPTSTVSDLSSTSQSLLKSLTGDLLNGVLSGVTGPNATSSGHSSSAGTCDILNLHLDSLNLDLLGGLLDVTTSPICLDVTAVRGPGNLLGNLLCSVSHLLDGNGNTGNAVNGLLNRVDRLLGELL